MRKLLFEQPYYARLAPVFAGLLKLYMGLMVVLFMALVFFTYSSLEALSMALDAQEEIAIKTKSYETSDAMPDVKVENMQRFNRDIGRLQRTLPTISIQPLALLNLIEARLPSDTRLQNFEYVRARGELLLTLHSRKKSLTQSFVSSLEKTKRFNDIQLNEGRSVDGLYMHTVVIKI